MTRIDPYLAAACMFVAGATTAAAGWVPLFGAVAGIIGVIVLVESERRAS